MAYLNGQKILMGSNVTIADLPIDQTYSPESENAQSGKAVAQALSTVGGGSGKGALTTICDITLTEEVNSVICADVNSFADISKVQDFYIFIEIPKHETAQNGNMQIKLNDGNVFGVVSNYDASCNYNVKWSGYSVNIPNVNRFSLFQHQFMINSASPSLEIRSTCTVINTPLNKIHIVLSNSASVLPIGTKIKIVGWVQ